MTDDQDPALAAAYGTFGLAVRLLVHRVGMEFLAKLQDSLKGGRNHLWRCDELDDHRIWCETNHDISTIFHADSDG